MALSDFWHRLRGDDRDRRDYESRPNFMKDDPGFERRGWRTGSDYYGNSTERYTRQGDDFEGEQHYRGSDDDWRSGSQQNADYGDTRGSEFSDRWQNPYGPGIPSTSIDYTGRSSDPGEFASDDRTDVRWSEPAGQREGGFRGRGPRDYRRSDDRLREEVCERLTDDHYVDASNIEVEVRDGEVTLTGSVESRDQKRRAENVADRLSGVKDVHNRLRVSGGNFDTPQPSV